MLESGFCESVSNMPAGAMLSGLRLADSSVYDQVCHSRAFHEGGTPRNILESTRLGGYVYSVLGSNMVSTTARSIAIPNMSKCPPRRPSREKYGDVALEKPMAFPLTPTHENLLGIGTRLLAAQIADEVEGGRIQAAPAYTYEPMNLYF